MNDDMSYLSTQSVDDLGRMVMALLGELWITRDRVALLELLLVRQGVIAQQAINEYVPAPEDSSVLEAMRDQLVASVVGAPIAATERSVDTILRRAGLPQSAPPLPA